MQQNYSKFQKNSLRLLLMSKNKKSNVICIMYVYGIVNQGTILI